MENIKSMFSDVLNEVLQCELDEQLGYDKHEPTESGENKNNIITSFVHSFVNLL
ncbi:MAG: hypothetical protein Q4G33_14510 [bacterium]|nr:hypothetical protein [bacterium]